MNRLQAVLQRIGQDLQTTGHRWALVGGLAVSVHTEPRFTRDVDIAVAVSDDRMAESLIYLLRGRGYRAGASVEHDTQHRLATVRLSSVREEESGVVVDLLFASSGVEAEIVEQADRVELVPGFLAPVARIGHLIALKLLARDDVRRPQDLVDLHKLLDSAVPEEIACAREAVKLIEERGFHRGRTLSRDLEQVMAERTRQ